MARRSGGAAAAPERHLVRFVRAVVLLDRAGDGIGTLVFTWATVVLLGGFSTLLKEPDFVYATVLCFLEAARIFSQNTRTEYQFFFRTRGSLRRPRLTWLILIVSMADILLFIMAKSDDIGALPALDSLWDAITPQRFYEIIFSSTSDHLPADRTSQQRQAMLVGVSFSLLVYGSLAHTVGATLFCDPWRRRRDGPATWSPLAAVLLLAPCLLVETSIPKDRLRVPRIVFFVLLLPAALAVMVSKLRFQRIAALVGSPARRRRLLSMRPAAVILCLCAVTAILHSLSETYRASMDGFLLLAFVIQLFGNLQIPAAAVRVALALLGLSSHYGGDEDYPSGTSESIKRNFSYSRTIFYRMVLLQAAFCASACAVELFSPIPRRLLARRSGLRRSRWGTRCVDMYYSRIYEQCSEVGVLAPKIKKLPNFAMDLITSSDSAMKQLYGVRMLHGLLQREPPPSKASLLSRLRSSTKTLHTLIAMVGWESPEDAEIRLSAAKLIHDLAETIQVSTVPGSIQNISSLLGADEQLKRRSPLLCNYTDSHGERQDTTLDIGDDQEHISDLQNPRCWQWMSTRCCCSDDKDQEESSSTDDDHDDLLLPVLGMSILDTIAGRDAESYAEISRAAGLIIPKIIGYTNEISRDQKKTLKLGSLKLLRRLSDGGGGEPGAALRKRMSEHPFLLRNLAEILDHDTEAGGRHERRKLAVEIHRNLAIDGSTRREIGRSRVITNSRVLERIMGTDDAGELEILISLSAQICTILPEDFYRELEHSQIHEAFVKKLVNALNSNMKPSAHFIGIRRTIVEQVLCLMELENSCSSFAGFFDKWRMSEALSTVEETTSKAENYMLFFGNEGLLMEHSVALSDLAARAKEQLLRRDLVRA